MQDGYSGTRCRGLLQPSAAISERREANRLQERGGRPYFEPPAALLHRAEVGGR
jgi:hypothetical protein